MGGLNGGPQPAELSLLGGFVFSVGGVALAGMPAESQRLIALLGLRDEAVTRAQAAEMLWEGPFHRPAEAGLRSALSSLEGPARHAVTVTDGDLALAEGVVVDVRQARSLARRLIDHDALPAGHDLGTPAVTALSEELLPGWYDDWAVIAAEGWRHLRFRALEVVATRLTAAGRLTEATAAALAAVRCEPLRETAWAALIRVHLAEGDLSRAFREYERYRVLLRTEVGVEPTPRLSQLLPGLPGS